MTSDVHTWARALPPAWYWYDWANSAYVTTTATVLLGPYLTAIAKRAACPGLAEGATCRATLDLLGVPVDPGSLFFYTATVATILSAARPRLRRRHRRPLPATEPAARRRSPGSGPPPRP